MPSTKNVDEMIMSLPKGEQIVAKRLRSLVFECLPGATEKGYYGEGIPFYSHHRMICFIWPSSVLWGPKKTRATQKNKGVSLGFCQGNLMSNEDGILQSDGRKQVYVMPIAILDDMKEDRVRALLFEAGMIDDMFGQQKRRIKKDDTANVAGRKI